MWIRRAFFRWLFPAVLILPLWLLIGWGVFEAGGWAFLWVLFIAIPSVGIAQLVSTLLVRARPSVQRDRAVSWTDVAGFGVWHVLTVLVGLYSERWFGLALAAAIAAALLVLWLSLRQFRREIAGGLADAGFAPQQQQPGEGRRIDPGDVTIITDAPKDPRRPGEH